MLEGSNSSQSQSLINHTDQNWSQRRRVTFSTEANDICYLRDVAPASTLTNEEKNSAWYNYKDMIHMKKEAKITIRRLRVVVNKKTSSTPPSSGDNRPQTCRNNLKRNRSLNEGYPLDFTASSSTETKESVNETHRGLEFHVFLGRQLKQYFATRNILKYQRKCQLMIAIAAENGNPNIQFLTEDLSKKLGYVSATHSRWARKMALLTGKADFKAAYEQSGSPIPLSSFEQLSKSPSKKKRAIGFSGSVGEFEINNYNKKQNLDSHKPTGSFFIPIDRMHGDIIPVNIF